LSPSKANAVPLSPRKANVVEKKGSDGDKKATSGENVTNAGGEAKTDV
jgi:hypothetical protein